MNHADWVAAAKSAGSKASTAFTAAVASAKAHPYAWGLVGVGLACLLVGKFLL